MAGCTGVLSAAFLDTHDWFSAASSSGKPVVNVNNNCSTGSTALYMARTMVEAGHGCVLALGFEKMQQNLSQVYTGTAHTIVIGQTHWDPVVCVWSLQLSCS